MGSRRFAGRSAFLRRRRSPGPGRDRDRGDVQHVVRFAANNNLSADSTPRERGEIMTKILIRVAVGLVAVSALSTAVVAQDMGSVTVSAKRVISEKRVGTTASGIPIIDVAVSYGVKWQDLDLKSHAGVMELQKRVTDTAAAACKELDRQYPDTAPSATDCAKKAATQAMAKVDELAAAAAKK
jgi:UrcA family protein